MSVVLIGGLDDYLTAVARGLVERGVPVTHLLDRYQYPASRQGVLAAVTSIDARQFTAPARIQALNHGHEPVLDAALMAAFSRAELAWLSVSDRYTQRLSVLERRRLFRELLEYFYRWLKRGAVTAIVFPNVPHAGWNNVLYFVAKHFTITTLILEPTRLNDRVMLWDDYETVRKVPAEYLAGAAPALVRQHIDAAVLAELTTDSSWMVVSDDINRESLQRSRPVGELVTLIRALARGALQRHRPPDLLFDPPWPWFTAHWRRYQLQRRVRQLQTQYERVARAEIGTTPYVLFFLNYQPEKTTTPMGGVFEDQLLAARLLAAALPVGWRLLVKEHPRQFGAHVDASPFRSPQFYDVIAQLPRTQLVAMHTPTASLLAGCAATATVTGSIGWQGLLAGKPTLNFGRSWYAACRSCYVVSSVTEIRTALAEVQRKDPTAVERDVLTFLAYERAAFIIGGNGDRYVARSSRPPAQLAESLADAIAQCIHRSLQSSVPKSVTHATYAQ